MTMLKRLGMPVLLLAGMCELSAQQATDFVTVEVPIGVRPANSVMWVKWSGGLRRTADLTSTAPDSGYIHFSRSPGGGQVSKYTAGTVTVPWVDTSTGKAQNNMPFGGLPPTRGTAFRPVDQDGMSAGVFYCIVALVLPEDTLVSNEFIIYVESPAVADWIGPKGTITDLTPTFSWKANAGVPYYHVILSDEALKIDTAEGTVDIQGLSIVWQAITKETQIVYGAPDPSGTITAAPPPLSPGQNYTWVVMNNYGNFPGLSSPRIKIPPGEFTIAGKPLRAPKCVYPVAVKLNSDEHKTITFKWTDLDSNANTYKVYAYVGSQFEGVNAKMAVWETEVAATDAETLSVEVNALSVFTSNRYVWKAIAIAQDGAGTAGDTAAFNYSALVGTMKIQTRENIVVANEAKTGHDTIVGTVGLVKLEVEVLDGSLEAPLLFYTDLNGNLTRERPAGTYRVSAVKDGFERFSKTLVVSDQDTVVDTFFLTRPDATIFGRVLDESNKGLNLAKVTGVSDRNDTVSANTDALGNFVLNCYAADWTVGAEMTGYQSSLPRKVTVEWGQSVDFDTVVLKKNPYTLSGVVRNTAGSPLLGVQVVLTRENVKIDEIPSTSQQGTFSFTVPAGDYVLKAEKTGFLSYQAAVQVLSSKNVTITMPPGARVVTGYVIGRSWVGEREVLAPIVNANVVFVKSDTAESDTVRATSDAVYGDYRVSLKGGASYTLYASAVGYAAKLLPRQCVIPLRADTSINDTLQGLGTVIGTVKMSATGALVANASVNLIASGAVAATARSASNGYFEIRGLSDNRYVVQAGRDGLVLDSVAGGDTVVVSGGRSSKPDGALLYMKPGDKTVKWFVRSAAQFEGSVKIQSPMLKTIAATDSLKQAGAGQYIVRIDSKAESLIDLAYHKFTVADTEAVHVDTVSMMVSHTAAAALSPSGGQVTLVLAAADSLDSAVVYYRDQNSPRFEVSNTNRGRRSSYSFAVKPTRDGSTMFYYFKGYRGDDIYGHDKETFASLINADTSRLTKYEVVPAGSDTLLFPSNYEVRFWFRGYYSSAYIPDTVIDSTSIHWALLGAQGATLGATSGLSVTVRTGSAVSTTPVGLIVKIDTMKTRLATASADTVWFRVSGTGLSSLTVSRTDARSPNPISTSPTDRAEFKATGTDAAGSVLTLTPAWSIMPASAGAIDAGGVFKPDRHFVGRVRVFASAGGVVGEYNPKVSRDSKAEAGLNVRFMVSPKATPDTADNGRGCRIVLPPNVVAGSDIGMLEMSIPDLRNQMKRGTADARMVDSIAYEISELENVAFDLKSDSIRLVLDIPEALRAQAKSGKLLCKVALWIQDSLKWQPLKNSVVAVDGSTVSAGVVHFSRYAIVAEPGPFAGHINISPNPFSPYVRPEGAMSPQGTAIRFRAESPDQRLHSIRLRIYNVVGDQVWALEIRNAMSSEEYTVWWDGRTTEREQIWNESSKTIVIRGSKMCRNGRYFAVVTMRDFSGKQRQYMKQVVLMK